MTPVLRLILGRKLFLLSSRKCPVKNPMMSFSLCTLPWKNFSRSKIGGWEFSLRRCYRSDFHGWTSEQFVGPNQLPFYIDLRNEIVLKHADSNIAFRFSGYDAMIKYLQEKETRNPLGSDIPSYPSPLLPVSKRLYGTAFVGRVFIEEPGEEAKYINPIWEDIDRKSLLEQIAWTNMNKRISGIPKDVCKFFRGKEKSLVKFGGTVSLKNGISHPLCNSVVGTLKTFVLTWLRLYTGCPSDRIGDSCSFVQLVITDFGWFVHLNQFYHLFSPDEEREVRQMRKREMTMHCNFQQNIIFREIVERECKDLKNKLSKEMERRREDEMLVCFHEAKQLRIQEMNVQDGSISPTVNVARPYSPFLPTKLYSTCNVGELPVVDAAHFAGLDIPDCFIKSAFANSEDPIQHIEDKVGTPVKIIPLFQHPHNPNVPGFTRFKVPLVTPRKVYKLVSNLE